MQQFNAQIIYNLSDINLIVDELVRLIHDNYRIFFFKGDIGVGKTTVIRHTVNKLLNKELNITSPTFTIVNSYYSDLYNIHHFDLYRIKKIEEIFFTGLNDFINDSNSIIFIEWPDIIENNINAITITLTFNGDTRIANIKS